MSSFVSRKNRVRPSVAAPGDTSPSDATGVRQGTMFENMLVNSARERREYV